MKLRCDLPWGGAFEFETNKMSEESVSQLFIICFALICTGSVIGLFYMFI